MSATALPAGADAYGGNSHGKRNVGVGRGAIEPRTNPEVSVDRANARHDGCVVGEPGGGPAADFTHFRGYFSAGRPRVLHLFGPGHGMVENGGQLFDLFVALRADIDLGARAGGDRVDAGAAFNNPDVDRYFRAWIGDRSGADRQRARWRG